METLFKGLTDKQRQFVLEYLVDLSQTKAARRAGYANPEVAANTLMKKPHVQRAIRGLLRPRFEQLELTVEAVLQELTYCLLRDPIDLADANGVIALDDLRLLPPSVRKTIDSIKVRQYTDPNTGQPVQSTELKLTSKLKAIELAMRYFGLLRDVAPDAARQVEQTIDWERLYQPNPAVSQVLDARLNPADGNGKP